MCWQVGQPASVEFDWNWALEREERRGDVLGFYHTHPAGLVTPSWRDIKTMQAWVTCLGKPLLCLIKRDSTLAAYLFQTDEDEGCRLAEAQQFPRSVIIVYGEMQNLPRNSQFPGR
jgi:hypothetical protein